MIRIEKIDSIPALEALEEAWGDLNRTGCEDDVFFSFDWFAAWWKIYGGQKKLLVLVVKDDDETIGIAPLMISEIRRLGRKLRVLQFIGYPDAERYGFIGPNKKIIAREVIRYLGLNRPLWSRADLFHLSADSLLGPIIRDMLRENGGLFRFKTRKAAAYEDYPVPPPDGDDGLGPAIDSARREFEPSSELALDVISEFSGIESNMPVFFQLHLNSHRDDPVPSHFSESSRRRFYYELVQRLSPKGRVNLVRLRSGDVPVAYGLNFIAGDKAEIHSVAVNPLFAGRSARKLFMLMETGMFAGQERKVSFSKRLPGSGNFPPGAVRIFHDISIFSRRSHQIWSGLSSAIMDTWLIEQARKSEKIRLLREKSGLILRKEGLGILLGRILGKAFGMLGGLAVTYYVYRYDGGPPRMTRLKVDIEIRRFGLDDIDRIATFYGIKTGDSKLETFRNRFHKNADCYVALHHGFVVAMVWGLYHEDRFRQHGVSLKPADDEVVISDALTSTIYRSMGIAPYLLGTMLADYDRRGLKAVAGVHRDNMPSRRGLEAYNFKHVRTDRVFKIFGIRII